MTAVSTLFSCSSISVQERIAALDASHQQELERLQAQLKEKEQDLARHERTLLELQNSHSDEKAALHREAKEVRATD